MSFQRRYQILGKISVHGKLARIKALSKGREGTGQLGYIWKPSLVEEPTETGNYEEMQEAKKKSEGKNYTKLVG